jgi:CheY-like chemotaxis protein
MLIEDNDIDATAIKRALKELQVVNPLVRKTDGQAALETLRAESDNHPCVILLDLNMPIMNGIEFLKIVKSDNEMRRIPVIVLTTSQDECDKVKSFQLSVAGYIVKPNDYEKFIEVIRTLNQYWTLSELPCSV